MSIEAMKLALEALENSVDLVVEDAYNAEQLYGNYPTRQGKVGGLKILAEAHKKAITALRQAIEQAQSVANQQLTTEQAQKQEPVAWMRQDGQKVTTASDRHNYPDYETRYSIPLYTTPPQRTEQNFCSRCGKRLGGIDSIHTCTPPMEMNT